MCAIEAGDFRKFVIRDSVPTKNAFERAGEGEFDDRPAICHEYSGGRELLNDSIVTGLIISRHLITIFEFYYKISPVFGERPRYATLANQTSESTQFKFVPDELWFEISLIDPRHGLTVRWSFVGSVFIVNQPAEFIELCR